MGKKRAKHLHTLLHREADCLQQRKFEKEEGKEETLVAALSVSEQCYKVKVTAAKANTHAGGRVFARFLEWFSTTWIVECTTCMIIECNYAPPGFKSTYRWQWSNLLLLRKQRRHHRRQDELYIVVVFVDWMDSLKVSEIRSHRYLKSTMNNQTLHVY